MPPSAVTGLNYPSEAPGDRRRPESPQRPPFRLPIIARPGTAMMDSCPDRTAGPVLRGRRARRCVRSRCAFCARATPVTVAGRGSALGMRLIIRRRPAGHRRDSARRTFGGGHSAIAAQRLAWRGGSSSLSLAVQRLASA